MTNAEYFNGRDCRPSLIEAYNRYKKATHANWDIHYQGCDPYFRIEEACQFAQLPAMRCLEFDKGDIVSIVNLDSKYKYGTVTNYGRLHLYEVYKDVAKNLNEHSSDFYNGVDIRTPDGIVHLDLNVGERVVRAVFPPELVDFVKAQLKSECVNLKNCPLKDEGACMKGE